MVRWYEYHHGTIIDGTRTVPSKELYKGWYSYSYNGTRTKAVTRLIPGHVAKLAEDKQFKADEMSSQPVSCKHGGDYVFVPFAMEDGAGTLGAHAHALEDSYC